MVVVSQSGDVCRVDAVVEKELSDTVCIRFGGGTLLEVGLASQTYHDVTDVLPDAHPELSAVV